MKRFARLIFKLSCTIAVIVDCSLLGDNALPGDGGFRGDGPAFDDGVATRIPLIGVAAEASAIVQKVR